jgi:hypothetical protein
MPVEFSGTRLHYVVREVHLNRMLLIAEDSRVGR